MCAEFCCNGTVVEDSELGQVIQLQASSQHLGTLLAAEPELQVLSGACSAISSVVMCFCQ